MSGMSWTLTIGFDQINNRWFESQTKGKTYTKKVNKTKTIGVLPENTILVFLLKKKYMLLATCIF